MEGGCAVSGYGTVGGVEVRAWSGELRGESWGPDGGVEG
jgi:hypothetical protein